MQGAGGQLPCVERRGNGALRRQRSGAALCSTNGTGKGTNMIRRCAWLYSFLSVLLFSFFFFFFGCSYRRYFVGTSTSFVRSLLSHRFVFCFFLLFSLLPLCHRSIGALALVLWFDVWAEFKPNTHTDGQTGRASSSLLSVLSASAAGTVTPTHISD